MTYSGFIVAAMTRRRRIRNPFAGLLAHLGLLSSLAVLAGMMLANGDGGAAGDGGGAGAGEGGAVGGAQQGSGAGGEGGGTGSAGTGASDGKGDGGDGKTEKVTFTKEQQAELDRIAGERAAAAAAKARKDAEAAAKTAAERAKMEESDRLKAEKADADKKATEATEKANQRAIRSDAKVAAVAAGVKADLVSDFLQIVDLTDIAVNDDGEPDAKAIKKAIDAKLSIDTFKAAFTAAPAKGGSSGGNHNGSGEQGKAKSLEDAVGAHYA